MKIDTAKLKENEVVTLQESVSPKFLDLNTSEISFKGDINITTQARKELSMLYTNSHLSALVVWSCSRCLKECTDKIEKDFDLQFPLSQGGRVVDIIQEIREEIITDYPLKFLCRDDCKGLCLKCGKDLNTDKCSCNTKIKGV